MTSLTYAQLVQAFPNVTNAADRAVRFASPDKYQKIFRLDTGDVEQWDGVTWNVIIPGGLPQRLLEGTGSPEGVVTASVSAIYQQTDGANGVVTWVKNSGTGNTGWRALQTSLGMLNVKDYGAKGDGVTATDGAVTTATTAFTSATAAFTSADVGKTILIAGAGAAGVELKTTIAAYVSATAVTLTDAAGTTVTGATYYYGTDDTTVIQTALTAAAGKTTFIPNGIYLHTTLTVGANSSLWLDNGATLVHTTYNENGVVLGTNATLRGGTIRSPATWDGTNAEWLYSVIYASGDGTKVEGVRLNNVPRVGVGFKQVNTGMVRGCTISGNYPSASWTGVETVHFGVGIDPYTTPTAGGFVVANNIIDTCVQGVFAGNYAAGSAQGGVISGNAIARCWNHGIYVSAQCSGFAVTGNSFNRCSLPIAMTGTGHTVTGNSLYTSNTGSAYLDVQGISVRDPIDCVVSGNTIIGDGQSAGTAIDVSENAGVVCYGNVVANNVVILSGGSSAAIRVGKGTATTFHDNLVVGNVVRSVGQSSSSNLGVVIVNAAAGDGIGCQVKNNTIVMLGDSHGLVLENLSYPDVTGNQIRLEFDAGSAKTLGGIKTLSCTGALLKNNTFLVTASWGTNVTFRAIWDSTGSTGSSIGPNVYSLDPTKLASGVPIFMGGTSAYLDEVGTGAAGLACVVGSRWTRTDGGAGTTQYYKESGTGTSGWVARNTFARIFGNGTAHVAGDYALSAGWGNTATVSTVAARDTGGRVSITCGGSGIAANPTITLTWKDGTWTTVPAVVVSRSDLVMPIGPFLVTTPGATTCVFTFNGLPVAGNVYTFDFLVTGK